MSDFSTQPKFVKTRKKHECNAFLFLDNSGFGEKDLDNEEWMHVKRLRENNGMIPAGTECYFSTGKFDGDMYSVWYDKDIDAICNKYDLYQW
jgi:hypothetical protein